MYKAAVRALMRYSIKKLNDGDYSLLVKLADPGFELAFPGDNSMATMFRPQEKGRHRHVTHRGITEATAIADRIVAEGTQFEIEDILVNGPPWNTRVAVRENHHMPGPTSDTYTNRGILFLEIKWGRLLRWEDYEDTQRVAEWDEAKSAAEKN